MKRIYALLFVGSLVLASNSSFVAISLGYRCQVAMQLRFHNLRQEAYPFDWLITPFESLYNLLENDFDGFLNSSHLVLRKEYDYQDDAGQFRMNYPHVWESSYNVILRHDFPYSSGFMKKHGDVFNKYQRRIDRFYKVLNSGKHVYFFRRIIKREEAQLLSELLVRKFPELKFTLVAISYEQEAKGDWDIPYVKNFYMPIPKPYMRDGRNDIWGNLFVRLGLMGCPIELSREEMREIYQHQDQLYKDFCVTQKH